MLRWISVLVLVAAFWGCTPEEKAKWGMTDQETTVAEPLRPSKESVWPPKAVWVVRKMYESPEQIAEVMDKCCDAGFNTVLFQVRGEGTVYYPSQIELNHYEMNGRQIDFDPLAVACREAHKRGMALHAWVNVMPAWKTSKPPVDPDQLYNAHPEWFWYDQKGERQPLDDFYVSLNPCLPEVRAYLVRVMQEIVRNYPVDGLHMDYIRFPNEVCPKGSDYPHDEKTLALYKKATGKRPQDDADRWIRWRTDQVSQLVREIRDMIRQSDPNVLLTAACGANMQQYQRRHFQNGPYWLRNHLVDLVFTMNYAREMVLFGNRQQAWYDAVGDRPVAAGIGEYMHRDPQLTVDQIKLAQRRGDGVAIFSYNSLFAGDERGNNSLQAIRPVLTGSQ